MSTTVFLDHIAKLGFKVRPTCNGSTVARIELPSNNIIHYIECMCVRYDNSVMFTYTFDSSTKYVNVSHARFLDITKESMDATVQELTAASVSAEPLLLAIQVHQAKLFTDVFRHLDPDQVASMEAVLNG